MKMKYIFLVIAIFVINICSGTVTNEDKIWNLFKHKYSKVYRSAEEEIKRRQIYFTNKKVIDEFNALNAAAGRYERLQQNELADMEHQEISNPLNITKKLEKRNAMRIYQRIRDPSFYPKEVDWRNEGVVTPVEFQGECRSCWAFSSVGALESALAIRTKILEPLSKQQLVDCIELDGAQGCGDGYVAKAYDYLLNPHLGLMFQRDYPYENRYGVCRYDPTKRHVTMSDYMTIASDELTLQEVVAYVGPVSVSIASDDPVWRFHNGDGIYDNPNCGQVIDHSVLIVGYGTDDFGNDYWIVKNSHGTDFGENGYIKMARNKDNQCKIAEFAYIPEGATLVDNISY